MLVNGEEHLAGVIIVKENGKAFALFMMELLTSHKIQKVVLHSLLSAVQSFANMDIGEGGFTFKFNATEMGEFDDMSANT